MAKWEIHFHIHNHISATEGEIELEVNVKTKEESKVQSFLSYSDSTPYFITLIKPNNPEVGMNDLKIGVYKRANMDSFPAVDDLIIGFAPSMTVMGHGSPNNVDPVIESEGIYNGKVNFTMTGKWELAFTLKDKNDQLIADTSSFDLTLK